MLCRFCLFMVALLSPVATGYAQNFTDTQPGQAQRQVEPGSQGKAGAFVNTLGPTFTETKWWNWIVLLGAILAGLVVGKVVMSLLQGQGRRAKSRGRRARGTALENAASPASLLGLTIGIHAGMGSIYMTTDLAPVIHKSVAFLYLLAGGWFVYNLVDVLDLWMRDFASRTESKLDDMMVPLIRKATRVFLVIVFLLVVAQNVFGLDITGWLAGLGIAGLAVSLAAQDSIKNLFGSITVFFDQPFAVGDRIRFADYEGAVEEIGFRSTRIRTDPGHLVSVPNMKFIDSAVTRVSGAATIRRILDMAVTYRATPEQLQRAVDTVAAVLAEPELADALDPAQPARVFFDNINTDNFNIKLIYWYKLSEGRDYWMYLAHAQAVNLRILHALRQAQIELALPARDVRLATTLPPQANPESKAAR